MSFDRVLPVPQGLQHEFSRDLLRKTNSLFEHKIINNRSGNNAAAITVIDNGPGSRAPCDSYATNICPSGPVGATEDALSKVTETALSADTSNLTGPLLVKDDNGQDRPSFSSPTESTTEKESAHFCICQPDPKVPRPRNAFILYRQHYQASVVAQNPGLANPEISKIIGEHWRALSDDIKQEWKVLAEKEKIRHQQRYPDYRYQPRRYGRDGHSRGGNLGISQNASGFTVCSRCGGRIMNHSISPGAPFTSSESTVPTSVAGRPSITLHRRYGCEQDSSIRSPSDPIKVESAAGSRQWGESMVRSAGPKRRRLNSQVALKENICRDKSANYTYPKSPYTPGTDNSQSRALGLLFYPSMSYRMLNDKECPSHDLSLKLPPLQASEPPPVTTPLTPLSQSCSSIEATVKTIPFLNKIKLLAKISPPLSPSFRSPNALSRGTVIAVDGQDPSAVAATVDYLNTTLTKEGKYHVRIFDGPELRPRDGSSEFGQVTVDYLDTISAWHRISAEISNFVTATSREENSALEEADHCISPRTIIPRTAGLHIGSPASSGDGDTGNASSPRSLAPFVPIAIVPRYQLTTADTFACSIPINDSYAPLDHWQWMASLWRACVGPDITVYIRECEKGELDRYGGCAVEVRLRDAATIVIQRAEHSTGLEEKTLKRVGFELEDFLAQ